MGQCACHPDVESRFLCMKHNVYLCEDCLQCRDPEIYCKFRSACPIWFMDKEQRRREAEARAGEERQKQSVQVTFRPGDRQALVTPGATLLDAAQQAGIQLNASCGGKGSCGKCKLVVESGGTEHSTTPLLTDTEKKKGTVLACQSRVLEDTVVRIPEETLERKLKVAGMGAEVTGRLQGLVPQVEPMLLDLPLELSPPTLQDPVSDLDRLQRGLKQAGCKASCLNVGLDVVRQLSEALRTDSWKVTASVLRHTCGNEILEVHPGNGRQRPLGLAIDLGTTSIVVYLVDMADGAVIAATSGHNRQAACGDDVINRMVCAEKNGVKKLSTMALATINGLIAEALGSVGAESKQVKNIALSGNTTMAHLLLQIEPHHIRREPYIPAVAEFPVLKAGQIGLRANPKAAVFVVPGPASYVGGDIVAGVLYAGLHREEPLTLLVDVGTNGEIVLGNRDWLMTAACSAGPAFEGGGIRWGMRAEEGAIESVTIDPVTLDPEISTVGDFPPRGICGSGMIELIAEMLEKGVIDPNGKIRLDASHPRIRQEDGEKAYLLVPAGRTAMDEDLVFTETDIQSLVLSKAAVYAGFKVLLDQVGLDFSAVDRIWISGGFGQHLNIEHAVTIGLLPDVDRSKFRYLGNSAIAGTYMALLSESSRAEARTICHSMTYIDFSTSPSFMEAFTSAQFLPHTDLKAFPSVAILPADNDRNIVMH